MGILMSKAMEENLKKSQEFMLASQKMQMERQMQMQQYMMEQQMAIQMARSRDLFHYWAAFYSVAFLGGLAGFKRTKKPAALVPLVPLTFIVTYFGDLAYGPKMDRIREEARRILTEEQGLLETPRSLPTLEILDERRQTSK